MNSLNPTTRLGCIWIQTIIIRSINPLSVFFAQSVLAATVPQDEFRRRRRWWGKFNNSFLWPLLLDTSSPLLIPFSRGPCAPQLLHFAHISANKEQKAQYEYRLGLVRNEEKAEADDCDINSFVSKHKNSSFGFSSVTLQTTLSGRLLMAITTNEDVRGACTRDGELKLYCDKSFKEIFCLF